jgi:hypothetical protein
MARLQPRLLILDPFVRLHRIDENAGGEVAPLLAYLRELQRRYGVAVLVVHHARKGAGNARAGQALRGSSEFHAWGDSNLYLRRDGDDLTLTVEHQAAPHLDKIQGIVSRYASELFEVAVAFGERDGQDYPVIVVPEGIGTPVAWQICVVMRVVMKAPYIDESPARFITILLGLC